jgi:predicted aspartyl protease
MNFRLWFLCSALVLSQMCFSQTQSAPPIRNRDLPGASPRVEIPFKLYRDYLIVVQGSVGTFDKLNIVIDTGVDPPAVDARIANKIPSTSGVHKLALLNQNVDVRQVVLPSLQVGPIRAKSLLAVVQDLSPFEQACGIRIDAVVGFGVLSLSSFSIDYRAKKIVFGPVESSQSAVPFDTGPPVLTVQLRIKGEPVRVLVDTGADELVLFECQLHGRLRQLPASGVLKRFFNGAGKEYELREVWLMGVRLGATDFGVQKGLEADGNANCGRSFDGVVGIRSLGLKSVAFDFEHRSLSWTR